MLDAESANHTEHEQGRGEQLAMRSHGDCLGFKDKGGGQREMLINGLVSQEQQLRVKIDCSLFLLTISINSSLQPHLLALWKHLPKSFSALCDHLDSSGLEAAWCVQHMG